VPTTRPRIEELIEQGREAVGRAGSLKIARRPVVTRPWSASAAPYVEAGEAIERWQRRRPRSGNSKRAG